MAEKVFLGIDLGASSGRVMAGRFDGQQLKLDEVHRFGNGPIHVGGRLYWDLLGQWRHVLDGLRSAAQTYRSAVTSVGVDTWGVDFGLLGAGRELLGNPYHYRDRRTQGLLERALTVVDREAIFAQTGLQFMELNTLYQLLAMRWAHSPLLEMAESLLLMPDLFHWLLTGEVANEATNVSTTQCYDPTERDWAFELLGRFELPSRIFGPIVQPGTSLGTVRGDIRGETGLAADVQVVLPATHDTASAVLAVPATASTAGAPPDWCYISSGTWSLMGMEVERPVLSPACLRYNFTNEGGVGGTIRLLKNIAGLWLLQECRRAWQREGREYDWDQISRAAEDAEPLVSLIDPDDPSLIAPDAMPAAIGTLCAARGERVPATDGAVARCALESLALKSRQVLDWLQEITETKLRTIHIVGGGARNRLLCQMTADACKLPVIAGPVEATVVGNLMMQAVAAGVVGSVDEARTVIRGSFDVAHYWPHDPQAWDDAFARFRDAKRKRGS